ncbi:hypothetical protein FKM82_012966 [Ascaphus truei]
MAAAARAYAAREDKNFVFPGSQWKGRYDPSRPVPPPSWPYLPHIPSVPNRLPIVAFICAHGARSPGACAAVNTGAVALLSPQHQLPHTERGGILLRHGSAPEPGREPDRQGGASAAKHCFLHLQV